MLVKLILRTVFLLSIFAIIDSCNCYKVQHYSSKIKQTDYSTTYIKTKTFEGVIFPREYSDLKFFRFKSITPSKSDIDSSERLIKNRISNFRYNFQQTNVQIDYKQLKKFRRQYFGFINDQNEKIINVLFFHQNLQLVDKLTKNDSLQNIWKTEYYNPIGSLTYTFTIKVNLTKNELFDYKDMF